MKKIKQSIIGGTLLFAICLILTGCGNQGANSTQDSDNSVKSFDNQAGGPPDDMGAGGPPDDGGGHGDSAPTGNSAAPTN